MKLCVSREKIAFVQLVLRFCRSASIKRSLRVLLHDRPSPIADRLDQSLLWRRFHHIVHLHSRIAEFLSARTVSAACGALLSSHHKERNEGYECDDEEATYYWPHDHRDIEGLAAQEICRLKIPELLKSNI